MEIYALIKVKLVGACQITLPDALKPIELTLHVSRPILQPSS